MGTTKKDLNLIEIFKDLGKVCLTEAKCQKCADRYCLVGYAKDCAAKCRISGNTYVMNGFSEIPPSDIRGGYDEYDVLHAISHLLTQCRSCKQDHFENCVINIIRSCLEVIEFGEEQIYEGNVLTYLMKLHSINPEKSLLIGEEYTAHKERLIQMSEKTN